MAGAAPAPAPPRPTAQAAEPAREAVRKTVTVLFCDLVGSTAFAEAVDTESAREAMGRYHAMARATVEEIGGTVAKFIGDGVMALFGVPEVAEDDAERAVLAGRALQRGFVPIREHVANRYSVDVGLRVGINTGEVVIDDADADLVGDVLNTAARLEAQCTPGEVLVGEDTWRLTRGLLEYEALGEVTVKGKRDGLATFQLVTDDDGTNTADDEADLAELAIPFVGRDSEIAQLRTVLDDAIAAGEARLATVIGSPGVGKTRLARELGRAVGDDVRFVELRCERAGTATFAPIAELLQTVTGFDDDATPDEIVAALRTLVGDGDESARLVELLGSFVGTASPRSTEDAFFAIRRLVEILGERQPLALVIDDIQWAEPLFLDLLEHLAQWAKASPVLVVGLARPEIRDIRPPLAEIGRRVSAVVALEGLDAAATELLAAELLGGAALPQELTTRLPDSTNGNPLFVRELVRMLVDDGVIVQVDDRWDLAVDAEAIEVPPTIQSLLATRVERLPHAERRVLELASVVGPEFPLGALAALRPATGGDHLDTVIERLRRKEQVEPTGTYWGDEPVIRFHHVLIRDAAYRRLLKGARADLHLEVGAWMETTAEHLTGDFDVVIAHHFEQAYLYRQQLNDGDASTTAAGRKAAALLRRAADAALQRDDLAAAGGYANRALATLDVDADEVPDLLLLACEAFLSSGDVGNGRTLVKQLGDHAVGDDRLEAWTTCFDAQLSVLTEPDQLREASDRAADAAAQLQHLGDQAGVAKARIIRAQALARLGQVGAAEGELDLALTAARAAHDRRRITAVLSAAPVAALWGPSPVPRAGGRCLDVVRLSRITADSPEVEATSVRCQAVLEALRGRFDTARALLATARATTEKIGLRQGLLETRYFAGIVELLAGDPVAAEPHLRRAYGGLGQLGIGADAGQAAAYLARALLLQDRLDEADELAADSDALAGQNLQTAIAARSAQAEILAVRGETVDALALAEEAVRLAADTDIILDHGNALATLARVRAAHGDLDGAQRAAASANDLFTQKGATVLVDSTRLVIDRPAEANVARDGMIERIELFAEADIDGALARAAEIDPAGFGAVEGSLHSDTDGFWNHADRLHRASVRLLEIGDRAGWAAMMANPIRYADRRPMLSIELDTKRDYVELILAGLDRTPRFVPRQHTVAARGDSHVLMTQHITAVGDPDGPFSEWLSLTGWQDGKCTLSINFDPTELDAAIDELNERYLDSIRVVDDVANFSSAVANRASTRREIDRIAAILDRSVESVDHRVIGWPATTGRDAASDRLASLVGLPDGHLSYTSRTLAAGRVWQLSEQRMRVFGDDGGIQESEYLSLIARNPATGLWSRNELFDATQLDAAMARYDEMVTAEPDPLLNDAVTAGSLANYCVRIGALDHLHRVIADDFVAEGNGDHGRGVTFHDLVSGDTDPTSVGYGVEYRHVVSIVGDRLALLSVDTDSGRRWSVEELDDTGRLRRVTHFPIADLGAATAHLAERQDVLGPTNDAVRTLNRWFAAYEALDHDEVARLLADEFEFVDHRPLGGPADKADMVRFAADGIDAGLGVLLGRRLRHLSDHIVVGDSMALATTADDEFVEANVAITVIEVRNGQIRRFELFPEDELDRAIARAAELDPEGFAVAIAQTPLPGEHEPWNKADRMHRQLTNALEVGDLRQWRQLMADDLRVEDRRALLGHELSGLSDVETFYDDWQGRRHQCAATTIAARGNDLVLLDMRWTPADDPDGPVLEHLQLNRWDSGQLIHAITFDPDDLRAAIDELDRMYLATLDPVTAGEYRDTFRFLNHLSDGELEPVMAVQRPDTVMVDHRPLGWGTEQRYDELRERFRTLTESDNSITEYVRRFHHWSPHSICIAIRIVNESPEGARLIDDHIIVSRTDPATGLSMRMDQFDDAQLDEALVFVNATMAEIDAELPQANLAVRAGAVANLAARDGNLDDLFAILADDFTAELADGRTVTSDDIRAGRVAPTEIGYGITDRRIEDALVDRIALLSVAVPSNTRVWSIESLDDTGRIARVAHLSIADPATANREYSVRARELVDTGPLPTLIRFTIASQDLDTAALRDVLAPNFSFTDHRELGFGHADRETYIDLQATPPTDDPSLTTALRIPRIEALTDHVMVCRFKRMYLSPHGESWEAARGISVNLVRDGAQEVVELFDDDQLGAALARAAELDPEGFGDAAADMPEDGHEPWNRADRLNRAASGHFFAGRIDAWAAMIADDYRGEQRRTLLGQDFTTKQDLETANRAMLELSAAPVAEIETLATRDDDLVLTHLRVTPADDPGGPLIDVLDLTQWNGDDQCIRTVTFDAEDVIAAIDELDRLAAPSLDPSLRARLDLNRLIDDAIRARDFGRLVASVDPDVEWIDHRPLGWGVVSGLGGYRNRLSTLTKIDGTLVRYMRRFYDGGPETLVFECRSQVTSPEGSVSVDDHILVGTSDPGSGLTTHIEQFDRDEVEFAIQRSEELARSTRLPFALTQAVTIVANANASLRVGNLADFLAHLADDLVAVGPEQTTVGIAELRSGTMTPADLGFGGHDREVIAVRGQRLVLVRVGPLEPTGLARHWSLSEIDDDHRIARVELFDDQDLLGAVDALEERALELAEPPTMPDPIWRWEQAHRHLDVGALGALTSDDFTLVDHRPRGYEPMDKAATLAQFQSWADDEALRGVPVHTSTRAVGATACVQPGAIWLPREGDYWIGNPFIAVITCRHDAVSRIELFGEDQLDDAMARANELDAFQARPEGWFHERTIDPVWLAERSESEVHAVDVALRFVDAVAAADVDALDAVVDPDFSTDDHRPVGWGPRSREAFLDAVRQRPATLGTGVAQGEFLLQVGAIGLIRYEVTTAAPETGGEVSEVGLGVMVVADGTVRWMELYAEADLAAAVVRTRELARLHQPNAGPTNRADRFARRNPALLGAEHATLETVLVRTDDHVLHRVVGPDAAEATYVATYWSADGALIARHDFDDSHDAQTHLDIACFDALGSAGSSGPILVEWGRVVRERDWERAAQLLAPEYRATSDQFLHSGGKATGEQLLTWFATEANQEYSRELVATEIHAVASVGGVISETDHYIDRDGSSFESSGAALITARDGMLTSATKSNEDKLPELLDELDRLTVEAGEQVAYLSETARALRSGRRSSADR